MDTTINSYYWYFVQTTLLYIICKSMIAITKLVKGHFRHYFIKYFFFQGTLHSPIGKTISANPSTFSWYLLMSCSWVLAGFGVLLVALLVQSLAWFIPLGWRELFFCNPRVEVQMPTERWVSERLSSWSVSHVFFMIYSPFCLLLRWKSVSTSNNFHERKNCHTNVVLYNIVMWNERKHDFTRQQNSICIILFTK